MARLFGTDGVRGVVNSDLTPEMLFALGRSGAAVLAESGHKGPLLVGRDTRRSGPGLEAALIAGMVSVGTEVVRTGIMTTPGIAYLVKKTRAMAGVVISASHNPAEYNGVKFFSREGYKLPDEIEDEVAARMASQNLLPRPVGNEFGAVLDQPELADTYIDFLVSLASRDMKGMHIVIDCAHGAASAVAPPVFERLGCRLTVIHNQPDGLNINRGVGALHPEKLAQVVAEQGADAGFAFDGDADRLVAVDERGTVADGDAILAAVGLHLLRKGRLPGKTVVATVMSNLGLELALQREGGHLLRTRVGDRYVLEALLENDLFLGGEQSGHVIFLDKNTTGDGVLTAMQLLQTMNESGKRLSELAAQMIRYPQVQLNVPFSANSDRETILSRPEIRDGIHEAEKKLGSSGRVLIRPSGTEPLVRIMVEGENEQMLQEVGQELYELIEYLQK